MATGRLSIELLEAFVAVAKTGNMTQAGAQLNRTQPCISTQLKKLEYRVGKPLIQRSERTMQLTQTGRVLLENAEDILRCYETTRQRISVPELTGEVHAGLPEWFMTEKLQSIFINFSKVHSAVKLKMTIADSATLHKMLDNSELSLAIALVSRSKTKPEEYVDEPLIWVANPNLKLEDTIPLILFNEPCPFREEVFSKLSEAGKFWEERFTTTSVAAAQIAVTSGLGVCALPAGAILPNFRVLTEDEGFLPLEPSQLAIYSGTRNNSATVDYLADHLTGFLNQSIAKASPLEGLVDSHLRVV